METTMRPETQQLLDTALALPREQRRWVRNQAQRRACEEQGRHFMTEEEETDSEDSRQDQTNGKTIALESPQDYRQRKYDFSDMQQKADRDGINTVNIMTIFDGTPSFAAVFPRIYSVYEEFIQRIRELKKELPDVIVKYGLLVFGAEGEGFRRAEFGDSYFTADEAKLFESIRNIRFHSLVHLRFFRGDISEHSAVSFPRSMWNLGQTPGQYRISNSLWNYAVLPKVNCRICPRGANQQRKK